MIKLPLIDPKAIKSGIRLQAHFSLILHSMAVLGVAVASHAMEFERERHVRLVSKYNNLPIWMYCRLYQRSELDQWYAGGLGTKDCLTMLLFGATRPGFVHVTSRK